MNKTQRILRYLSIHGPATSRQIADGLNMEKTGHVAALLRGYREKGRVLYNADMIWSISPEYDAQRSADIMAAVDLLKRAGYTVAPPCEKRQPARVMQERCTGREAEREKLRKDAERYQSLLEAVLREIPHRKGNRGNAPGHAHSAPGIWDEDNGALAGKECAWCKVWNEAVSAMQGAKP